MISSLQDILKNSRNAVFFGGAGVSTESGIPDFRSADGIFHMKNEYPPEKVLSRTFFDAHPDLFFDFFRKHLVFPNAQPNRAHRALALLEQKGCLHAVITQNVDGLHQAAGSENVIELHGSTHHGTCMYCKKAYPLIRILDADSVPRCSCGGIIKPDVVLYEEPLDEDRMDAAVRAIANADTLIVGGTSLVVYPAAGLLRWFSGDNLVILNKTRTPHDEEATLRITLPIGQSLGDAVEQLYGEPL